MKRKLEFGLVTGLLLSSLLLSPSSAHAQRSPSSVSSSTSMHSSSSYSGVALVRSGVSSHRASVSPAVRLTPLTLDRRHITDNADLAVGGLFGPPRHLRPPSHSRPPKNTRVSPGFFLFLDGGGAYYLPETGEQAPEEQAVADQTPEQKLELAEAPPYTPESEGSVPLPDEGQFTFVLHNGTQIEAVAFTHVNDKIVYITPEGGRRTIAVAELDSSATERVNQDRGTPIQLLL